jgi:hypothetical protein
MIARFWNVAERNIVASLLRQGATSTQIAAIMGEHKGLKGITRNSIIGLVHRDPVLREIGFKKRVWKPRRAKRYDEPVAGTVLEPLMRTERTLVELASHHCRFPLWKDDADIKSELLFCAEVKVADSSYCAVHRAICLQGVRPSNTRRAYTVDMIAKSA